LLTPCFDEFGNHGIPDESCFCGVDTPHIHAHLRELCAAYQEHQQQQGGQSNKASVSANYSGALTTMLASQTLHPIPDDDGKLLLEFSIPATEGMPSACNSREIRQLFVGKNKSNFGTYSDYKASNSRRVLQKVQHDDHSDYLVHNIDTGELHLEHPCADCGSDDVHGRFQRVGKRLLSKQSGEGKDVHLHFFEIAHTPFNVLEHFTNLFEPTSDRVAAAENLIKTPRTTTKPAVGITHTPVTPMQLPESVSAGALARSTFICDKICCSSEAKMIERLLKSTSGVQKVMINIPLKQVIVHHNPKVLQAVDIVIVLNKNNDFGASIQHDGGVGAGPAAISLESGRSQFFVSHICCASEIPAINKILQPLKGISNVSINTTTKMVFVDHIFETISAQQITDALNKEGFGATLKFDAGSVAQQESSSFVRSVLTFPGENIDTQVLTQFLKMYDATQVETFVVDFPSSSISVVHNPFSLSVRDIATALHDETGIVVTISTDGADLSTWELPKFEESDKVDSVDTPTYPRPTVVLCGLFWVISMISYFGGNW
jgi:copper chaperone CopZ